MEEVSEMSLVPARRPVRKLFLGALLLLSTFALFAVRPPLALAANPFKISIRDEKRIGRNVYRELLKKDLLEIGTDRARRLEQIGQRLVEANGLSTFEHYTFALVKQDQVNAFATPGGYVYLFTGMWKLIEGDDDMIAGVLGHELAHTERRHIKKNYEDQVKARLGLAIILGVLGASQDWWRGVGIATDLVFLKYSRDQEEEADKLGIIYAYRAGYDPFGMSRVMEILKQVTEESGGAPPEFLSTHPSSGNRIERTRKLAAEAVVQGTQS